MTENSKRATVEIMSSYYGKRPLWQWILLYVVIGGVVYALVYYFVFAKSGGYSYTPQPTTTASTSQSSSNANAVSISGYKFSSQTVTVKVGESVTWTNNDFVGHSATADDGSFDTGILAKGASKSITFSKAGTYTYHCSAHPNMTGTIIVQ